MPLYEYRCQDCGREFEDWKSISRRDEAECPACKSAKVTRLVRAFGLIGGSGRSTAPSCAPSRPGGG